MPRPRIAFKTLGRAGHFNHAGAARRIHGFNRGQPDQIAAGGAKLRKITILITRIARQIIIGVELQRIDEDGSRDRIRPSGARRRQQGNMPIMQRAHGGHQAKAATGSAQDSASGAERGKVSANLHGAINAALRIAGQAAKRHGLPHECRRPSLDPLAPWPRPPREGWPPLGLFQ